MASARAFGAALAPFASGVYVNVVFDQSPAELTRAYGEAKLARLAALKHRWDPDNVFHLNQNIAPRARIVLRSAASIRGACRRTRRSCRTTR